ncbi:hypothetical protein P5G65_16560 [Paenibacillus chondroitinus]|uniref:Alpha-L-rhamnosidase domain-containing protein n=1 Tax=Paenibacillus chondroitinus TaxID=59842 RepID=A0ABU6DDP7_9BACL|nr:MULTISPECIES: hypothetical protein [Paenibacillus]MCY9659867.1 hypothetical protein [Paenibacillus anseongense]MEB4795515.1 hypothetical protein [Paenibacillus chondroitinus]
MFFCIGIGIERAGIVRLGERVYTEAELENELPLSHIRATLPAGDHLLLYTVNGPEHGHSNRIGVDADQEIAWISPLEAEAGAAGEPMSPFVQIGPSITYSCKIKSKRESSS